jgi:two-component system, OmpR family, KDP operon response regulator KdpE
VTRILIVDDEPQIIRALRINLQARNYEVTSAATGKDALRAADDEHPDLVILDLGLPDMKGVDVVDALRRWSPVPILVLSGRLHSAAKVEALDAGADDYVTKPFAIDELLARLRALTRRRLTQDMIQPIRLGRFTVDLTDRRIARTDGGTCAVHLTPTEWRMLDVLLSSPGRLVSQRQLLQRVWGPTHLEETHYLRQYMKTLRRKLESDPSRPQHLLTEPGMGYRFQP